MPNIINENDAASPAKQPITRASRQNIEFASSWLEKAFAERLIELEDARETWCGHEHRYDFQTEHARTTIIVTIDPSSQDAAYAVSHLRTNSESSEINTYTLETILPFLDTIAPLYQSPLGTIERDNSQDRWGNKISLIRIPNPPVPGTNKSDVLVLSMANLPSRNHTVTRERVNYDRENGPRLFLDIRTTEPDNDTIPSTLTVGPYKLSWGDGDFLGCATIDNPPALDLSRISTSSGYSSKVITDIIRQMLQDISLWYQKD